MKELEEYADDNILTAVYASFYARLFGIYNDLIEEQNVLSAAGELKDLLEEMKP